jgi:hypothetical protein
MRGLTPAHFPLIYSMSLARSPVSYALGNLKEVMSQDLDVSLHCHCNFTLTVSGGLFFLRRANYQRIELASIGTESFHTEIVFGETRHISYVT